MPTFYQVLLLSQQATATDIKRSFRQLSLRYHPDHCKEDKVAAHQHYLRITEAYAVLSNPASRRAYDQSLGLGLKQTTQHQYWKPAAPRNHVHPSMRQSSWRTKSNSNSKENNNSSHNYSNNSSNSNNSSTPSAPLTSDQWEHLYLMRGAHRYKKQQREWDLMLHGPIQEERASWWQQFKNLFHR